MSIVYKLNKIAGYYRTAGIRAALRQVYLSVVQRCPLFAFLVFSSDLDSRDIAQNPCCNKFTLHIFKSINEIITDDLNILLSGHDRKRYFKTIKKRFAKGACLWVLKSEKQIIAFLWSRTSSTPKPYFFPLESRDVNLFDNEVLPEFRYKGNNRIFLNMVMNELKKKGYRRVLIETREWNLPQINSLSKTDFRKIGEAYLMAFFGKTIVVWK